MGVIGQVETCSCQLGPDSSLRIVDLGNHSFAPVAVDLASSDEHAAIRERCRGRIPARVTHRSDFCPCTHRRIEKICICNASMPSCMSARYECPPIGQGTLA